MTSSMPPWLSSVQRRMIRPGDGSPSAPIGRRRRSLRSWLALASIPAACMAFLYVVAQMNLLQEELTKPVDGEEVTQIEFEAMRAIEREMNVLSPPVIPGKGG